MATSMSYIQGRDGNLYVGPSRVTVANVITRWKTGRTPEELREDFPTVPLVAIYGTITYYLEHQEELDSFFRETEEMAAAFFAAEEDKRPEFYAAMRARFAEARQRLGVDVLET